MTAAIDDEELTRIPRAMARHFARNVGRRADLEELESVANLAFAQAMLRFDPALSWQGEAGRRAFVLQAVRLILVKHCSSTASSEEHGYRRRVSARLDEAVLDGRGDERRPLLLCDLLGEDDPSPDALAEAESFALLISVLPVGRYREAVRAIVLDGLNGAELAQRWGVTRARVQQILTRALSKLEAHHYPAGDPRPRRKKGKRQQKTDRPCRPR